MVRPGTTAERLRDSAIHLTALAAAAAVLAVAGHPALWLAVLLPLGPLLLGRVLAGGRAVGLEHRARAVDFNITVALYALAIYGVLRLGPPSSAPSRVLAPARAGTGARVDGRPPTRRRCRLGEHQPAGGTGERRASSSSASRATRRPMRIE